MANNIDRLIESACARRDLSRAEYALMSAAGYRPGLPADSFVKYARRLNEGGREPLPSLEQLQAALATLRERGLLTVLEEKDLVPAGASGVPALDSDQRPGDVDFTPDGYRLFREVVLEASGPEHLQYKDSGFVLDETSRCFTVFAETGELCLRRIGEILAAPEDHIGGPIDPVRAVEVTLPQPGGPWRPNPFLVIESGFRATVRVPP
jgi:hypothetical protein